jgi:hypothetical protein
MGTSLSGLTPATTFDALIKVGDNSALSASLKTISDGEGNDSPLKLSTSAVGIGSITNVETEINGKQATLVSGSSIKTINSTSVLGSGDIAVQATLVSGTNIKTINSTSLLGSGDISISASAGGSDSQIQFNDSGAFGADSLFNWDNTNKRLGVGETTPTARVHIKGEGATSGTTALLVQNSDGTELLKVLNGGSDKQVRMNSAKIGSFGIVSTRIEVGSGVKTLFKTNGLAVNETYAAAHSSAQLDVSSTTKGFLPPRMTTTQVEAIEATAGLVIYDTSTNILKCYDGSSWNNLF